MPLPHWAPEGKTYYHLVQFFLNLNQRVYMTCTHEYVDAANSELSSQCQFRIRKLNLYISFYVVSDCNH